MPENDIFELFPGRIAFALLSIFQKEGILFELRHKFPELRHKSRELRQISNKKTSTLCNWKDTRLKCKLPLAVKVRGKKSVLKTEKSYKIKRNVRY